jgi:ankyrin repeat protein
MFSFSSKTKQKQKSKNKKKKKHNKNTKKSNEIFSYGQTALHIACARNRVDIVDLLLRSNSNINAVDWYYFRVPFLFFFC